MGPEFATSAAIADKRVLSATSTHGSRDAVDEAVKADHITRRSKCCNQLGVMQNQAGYDLHEPLLGWDGDLDIPICCRSGSPLDRELYRAG